MLLVDSDVVVDTEDCAIPSRDIAMKLVEIANNIVEFSNENSFKLNESDDGDTFTISADGYQISFYCEVGGLNYVERCVFKDNIAEYVDWLCNPLDLIDENVIEAFENRLLENT